MNDDLCVVVGGSGFVGTRLCSRLRAAGLKILVVDKRKSDFFPTETVLADVRNYQQLLSVMPESSTWINLAAEHRDDVLPRRLYDEVNVEGAKNVCRAAEVRGVSRLIFTSSVAVYGLAAENTDESGELAPFNDYGRTKLEAESVYREWQQAQPGRSLVIVRPTVIFGERNRGNVFNLLNQIHSGKFAMIGNGRNRKSMAYVENVAAFIEHCLVSPPGTHTINYVDKPDLDMNELVSTIRRRLGRGEGTGFRIPAAAGYLLGICADAAARLTGKQFPISAIRVKKFCATTQFSSAAETLGFKAPFSLGEGLERTIQSEFLERNQDGPLFYTE